MAYYDDRYTRYGEHMGYDLVNYQNSVSFFDYDLDAYDTYVGSDPFEPKTIDHYHPFDDSYSATSHEISYLPYNSFEHDLISYEPTTCYTISYSKSKIGFNEPEFEEYDPTPYGGGYDMISHYGKPLPPSDQTCYPRSTTKPIQPTKPISEPEKPIDPTKPIYEHEKPIQPIKPILVPESKPGLELAPSPIPLHNPVSATEIGLIEDREKEEYGYDYPWPEYDKGYDIGVGYSYGYGKPVVQVPPCEYDPEVVDFCESIFGNWPCLARIRNQHMKLASNPVNHDNQRNRHQNPWERCADYIFGELGTS